MTSTLDTPGRAGLLPGLSPRERLGGAWRRLRGACRQPGAALALLFACSFIALLLRNLHIPAPVCNDEVIYKTYSQNAGDITRTTSRIALDHGPNAVVYYHLYQLVHACGSNAYAAAKALNTFFFCLALFPIYGTARLFVSRPLAVLVVVAGLLSGASIYTTLFMPESLYYCAFWVLAYCFLALIGPRPGAAGVVAGVLVGTMFLIKPHAVVLLAALNGVLLGLCVWAPRLGASWKAYLLSLPGLNAGFLVTVPLLKLSLGQSINTPVLGASYGRITGEVAGNLLGDARLFLVYLGGHLVLGGIFLLLPLLAVVWRLATAARGDRPRVEPVALGLLVLWCSGALLGMAVEASTAGWAEERPHVHQRYYSFLFPLFLIAFYAFYGLFSGKAPRLFSLACVAGGTCLLLGAAFVVPRLDLTSNDCPDVFWLAPAPGGEYTWLYVFATLSVAVLALFAVFRSRLPHLFTAFFLAAAVTGTWENYRRTEVDAAEFEDDVRAAQLVNGLLSGPEIESGCVVTPGTRDSFAFLLSLNAVPRERIQEPRSHLAWRDLPPKTLWVALKGDYQLDPPGGSTVLCPGWRLVLFTPRAVAADAPALDVRERGQLLESLKADGWRKPGGVGHVPLREVPLPVVPAAVARMTWKDGAGAVSGGESFVGFALPSPQRVAAIVLKYSYQHDNSPATLRAEWRRSDGQDFVEGERGSALKLPTNPGERTATVWVNAVIDEFRIHPNDVPCTFRIAGIVLLVPEKGQPGLDSGSGAGFLDVANDGQITGWAWDSQQPDSPILVDIYDGGKKLATVAADQFREDLAGAGVGNGEHGFSYRTPGSLKDGQAHTIRVKTAGAGKELAGSPKTVTLEADGYQQLVRHVREVVRRTLPPDATVLVVSKGDDDLLKLEGRRGWHFPPAEDGDKPADSAAAIARLEALRAKGGQFLLLPETSFWWLDHYREFKRHLDGRYRRTHGDPRCIIYELSGPGPR
jgi:hypothetical protein